MNLKFLMTRLKLIKLSQCGLDREADKVSALSSDELENYKYLTGEDLGYKAGVVGKAKFRYSPLGEAFSNKSKSITVKTVKIVKRNKNLTYFTTLKHITT